MIFEIDSIRDCFLDDSGVDEARMLEVGRVVLLRDFFIFPVRSSRGSRELL